MVSNFNGLKKFVSCLAFPLIYCTVTSTAVVVTYSYKSLPAAEQLNSSNKHRQMWRNSAVLLPATFLCKLISQLFYRRLHNKKKIRYLLSKKGLKKPSLNSYTRIVKMIHFSNAIHVIAFKIFGISALNLGRKTSKMDTGYET